MDKLFKSKPIIALSPMDGVTDVAYRHIQSKYGGPDVSFTEFVHVMGVCQGSDRLLLDFLYTDIERPVIAQIYGSDPEYFYHATKIVAALGFDGVDINMGCPARGVVYRGGGAALIRTPELAKEIVVQTRKGYIDYFQDKELTGITDSVKSKIVEMAKVHEPIDRDNQAEHFTLSVKTRIGFDKDVATDWMKHLTEVDPDWISVHGRTLKQMYQGMADWDSIAKAVEATHIPVWGNGDINSANDAVQRIKQSNVAGVLIGRGTYGNPWIFKDKERIRALEEGIPEYVPTLEELLDIMLEHAILHEETKEQKAIVQMRKNFAWYIKGFPGAAQYRARLVRVNSVDELREIIAEIKEAQDLN